MKSEKVGPTAQSRVWLSAEEFRPGPEKCRRHVGPYHIRDFDGVGPYWILHVIKKLDILTSLPPSETGDRTTPVSDQRDCVPPPLALPAQDSVPRAPMTATLSEGHCARRGCVDFFIFALFVLSGECSLGAHGLLRFRTNDVLLGTSGVGCAYLLCLISPGMLYRSPAGIPSHSKRSLAGSLSTRDEKRTHTKR